MKINWKLDEENGIDLDELLGEIQISDEMGNIIIESCVYLETFLFAISEGLVSSQNEGRYIIDLIDEPTNLVVARVNDTLSLEFGRKKITTDYKLSVSDFLLSFKQLRTQLQSIWVKGKYLDLEKNVRILEQNAL